MTKEAKNIINRFMMKCTHSKDRKFVGKKIYIPITNVTNAWQELIKEFKKIGIK